MVEPVVVLTCWNTKSHQGSMEYSWTPKEGGNDVCPLCGMNHKVTMAKHQPN